MRRNMSLSNETEDVNFFGETADPRTTVRTARRYTSLANSFTGPSSSALAASRLPVGPDAIRPSSFGHGAVIHPSLHTMIRLSTR